MTNKIYIDFSIPISMLKASELQTSGYISPYIDEAIDCLLTAITLYTSGYDFYEELSQILDTYTGFMFDFIPSSEYIPFMVNQHLEDIVKIILTMIQGITVPFMTVHPDCYISRVEKLKSKTDTYVLFLDFS